MSLHWLQTHPPGLPDLRQGKWGPQDSSGPASNVATLRKSQLGGMPELLDYREER